MLYSLQLNYGIHFPVRGSVNKTALKHFHERKVDDSFVVLASGTKVVFWIWKSWEAFEKLYEKEIFLHIIRFVISQISILFLILNVVAHH